MQESIEERRRDLYTAVGIALSRWNRVEWSLCNLFSTCISADFSGASSRAYWAVLSFDAKLKMVDAAMRARCSSLPRFLSQWNKINNRLSTQNRVRNKIAHGTVMHFSWEASDDGFEDEDVCLAPYFYALRSSVRPPVRRSADIRPIDRMYAADIMRCEKAFCVTHTRIDNLQDAFFASERLPKLQASLVKLKESGPSRASDRIAEAPALQPRPSRE